MSKIDQAKLCLSRRDLSAIARNLQKRTGLCHTEAIDAIAQSAGYSGGNALMGSLKAKEQAQVKACPAGKEAGYLYEVKMRFISDDELPDDLSLSEIEYETDMGGSIAGTIHISRTPIAKHDLGRLAEDYGSTPDFFPCFQDEDDEDNHPES
jgi:hypothetical protein